MSLRQAHSSLARAARTLGFRPEQVRVLPVDDEYRMRVDGPQAAIATDLAAGRRPLVVMAVAGTTNTGAVDLLPELAEVCREHGIWLHVDAAYGGFAAITERGRQRLAGIELADSVTLDPHKWLYQPFECGALLVREGHLLREAFEIHPDYLQDSEVRDTEVNLADHGLQLTRMSRAIKVWLSMHYFGLDAFAPLSTGALDLAEHAQRYVEASSELELIAPATLGVVCFRRHPAGEDDEGRLEQLNAALVRQLSQSGEGMVSPRPGSRAATPCASASSTTAPPVRRRGGALAGWSGAPAVVDSRGRCPRRRTHAHADVGAGWPTAPARPRTTRALPLFEGVDDQWVRWVATVGRRRHVEAGDLVVRQWDVDRDFYLFLSRRGRGPSGRGAPGHAAHPATTSVSSPHSTGVPASATRGWRT